MEQDERESSGVARNQNVVYTLPHDWGAIGQFLAPALERVDRASAATQLLVLTPDAESAVAVAEAAFELGGDDAPAVVPVSNAQRAARVIRARAAQVVAGAPADLLTLVGGTALKLDALRTVVIAWADDILAAGAGGELEALMAEIPKETARVLVAGRLTTEVTELVERYLRRARRVTEPADDAPAAAAGAPTLTYFTVAPSARAAALRRLLDALDPPSVVVYARSADSEREVRRTLRTLGHAQDDPNVRVTRERAEEGASLVVLYDLPHFRRELRAVLGEGPRQVVAFIQPRQLEALRAHAAGAEVRAVTLPDPADRARRREERLRGALRAELDAGVPSREVLALEPLLERYDGIEIAAAALRLLEKERMRAREAAAAERERAKEEAAATAPWTRIFVSVGARDDASARDLVGAIANETGVSSDKIGKIELRDSHSIVEIATPDAARVVEKLNGTEIRGRRVTARVDTDRPARERPARERAPREGGVGGARGRGPQSGGDRGDRGDRGGRPSGRFERGPRGADRGPRGDRFERSDRGGPPRGGPPRDRGARGDRPPRGDPRDRGERGDRGDRGERAARPRPTEREQWAGRGEQMRNARRPRREGE